MIDRLVQEINIALDNNCPLMALMSSLSLPDICGKAEYPELDTGKRYKEWVDNFIKQGEWEYDPETGWGTPFIDGAFLYSLRCDLLHQGNANLRKKDREQRSIDYLELVWREQEGSSIIGSYAEMQCTDEGEEIHKKYSINLRELCKRITTVALRYYNVNQEKFTFFDYEMTDIDFHTKKIFHVRRG